jgi:uncharacterized membrane protein/predicted DsbA family dithiol-disulfide isomerase
VKTKAMIENRSRGLLVALGGCGWLVSGWLLLRDFALAGRGPALDAGPFCPGCDEVLGSAASHQLGFPLAGWGLVYFAVVALLVACPQRSAARVALFVNAVGFGVSAVLAAILVSTVGGRCVPCLAAHAINLFLLISLWVFVSKETTHSEPRLPSMRRTASRVLPVVGAILLGVSLQTALFRPDTEFGRALAEYESAPRHDIAWQPSDAVLGSASAPVRMVVFSSFQCPACKSFVELMRDVRRRYPDQVSIVFKHFPLGRECNPILKREMQPRACAAAFAAEAALQQNVFWQYHDRLFASSLLASEQILTDAAKETGIDLAKWESDRRSPAVKLKVASDVSLGTALGVEATPAVFINGKRLTYLSRRMVGLVISRELSRFASSGETARR